MVEIRLFQIKDTDQVTMLFHETVREVNIRDYLANPVKAWAPDNIHFKNWAETCTSQFTYVADEDELIWGNADPINPIEGGTVKRFGQFLVRPSTKNTLQTWTQLLNCPACSQTIYDKDGVRGITFSPCREGSEVTFYSVANMGIIGWVVRMQCRLLLLDQDRMRLMRLI